MPQPKTKKIGRPKLPKGDAKGRIVPIRFNAGDLKRIESAAKANQKTVSEWVRGLVATALGDCLQAMDFKLRHYRRSPHTRRIQALARLHSPGIDSSHVEPLAEQPRSRIY